MTDVAHSSANWCSRPYAARGQRLVQSNGILTFK